jgi:hypothetical protein
MQSTPQNAECGTPVSGLSAADAGLLTIPGTLPPVPRARPSGARALPHAQWDFFADWAARRQSSPPPCEELHASLTQDASNKKHGLQPAQDALVTRRVPKSGHKMQPSRPHKMRGHGRERLGLKACSPRIRAVTARGKRPPRNCLRHIATGFNDLHIHERANCRIVHGSETKAIRNILTF